MARTGNVVHATKRVRATHSSYRRNAVPGVAHVANTSAKAIHSADVLFDVVDGVAAALVEGLLRRTPSHAEFANSIARLEESGRYESVVRGLRNIVESGAIDTTATAEDLAVLAEEAAAAYRQVIQATRGLKPRRLKDARRDEAERTFKSRLSALECMAAVVGGRSRDLAQHFSKVATVALDRTRA